MDKKAIVVGISGMDGESLTHLLLSKGYQVVGTYRQNTQIDPNHVLAKFPANSRVYLRFCDISDRQSVSDLFRWTMDTIGEIDEIYLLAAQSHVGHSFASPESTVLTNGMSAFNFLECIRQFSPKTRIYFAATSELLGGDPTKCPFDESSTFECRSPYAIGKELGTRWIDYYRQTYGIFACYGILFNHSNCSRGKHFFIRRVTNGAARIALGKQTSLALGNLDFWRDEHWSDFGVEMMWKMLQLDKPDRFIVCRGECHSGEQFLDAAFGYFNLDWKKFVVFDKDRVRPNEVVKLVGSSEKAQKILGWRPNRMSFQDHIGLMCKFDYEEESGKSAERPDVFKLFP